MKLCELITEEQEAPTPQEYAADILSGKNKPWHDTFPAYYDAEFGQEGDTPHFINIHTKIKGQGFGYIAFLDFLRHCGPNQEFTSTPFTGDGQSLFTKAAKAGLIKQTSEGNGLAKISTWTTTNKDAKSVLSQLAGE